LYALHVATICLYATQDCILPVSCYSCMTSFITYLLLITLVV